MGPTALAALIEAHPVQYRTILLRQVLFVLKPIPVLLLASYFDDSKPCLPTRAASGTHNMASPFRPAMSLLASSCSVSSMCSAPAAHSFNLTSTSKR